MTETKTEIASAVTMDGCAHLREAARLITAGEYDEGGDEALLKRDIALAQAHAALATADFLGDIAQELSLIRRILDATMGS